MICWVQARETFTAPLIGECFSTKIVIILCFSRTARNSDYPDRCSPKVVSYKSTFAVKSPRLESSKQFQDMCFLYSFSGLEFFPISHETDPLEDVRTDNPL